MLSHDIIVDSANTAYTLYCIETYAPEEMADDDDMPPPIEGPDDAPPPIENLSVESSEDGVSAVHNEDDKTLMQNMIDEATVARKKKEEKKARLRKKADKSFGKGLKKVFSMPSQKRRRKRRNVLPKIERKPLKPWTSKSRPKAQKS